MIINHTVKDNQLIYRNVLRHYIVRKPAKPRQRRRRPLGIAHQEKSFGVKHHISSYFYNNTKRLETISKIQNRYNKVKFLTLLVERFVENLRAIKIRKVKFQNVKRRNLVHSLSVAG